MTLVSSIGCRLLLAGAILWSVGLAGLTARAEELTFDLKIEQGRVPPAMRTVRVNQGDVVKLRWTSDRLVVLHLHGYDIERTVQPGAVAEMNFTARAAGRFAVYRGVPKSGGGHSHEAPIVTLEVRPR
jgi:hypothetical protein